MSEEKKEDGRTTRPFADFLADHNAGQGHRKAGETLQDLVAAVVDTGKKGSMTVTITVEPMKNAQDGTLLTHIAVASKIPTLPEKAAIFYADTENNLRRTDPRQLSFDSLREVETGPVEVKDAPAAPTVREVGR